MVADLAMVMPVNVKSKWLHSLSLEMLDACHLCGTNVTSRISAHILLNLVAHGLVARFNC